MKNKKQPESRHGKRAPGKSQTSVTMSEDLLNKAKEAAAKDGRSLSNWLEQLIKKSIVLVLAGGAAYHHNRSPKDWSAEAMTKSGKALAALVASKLS